LNTLRQAAWSRIGIELDTGSIIAAYARQQQLGMPVTQEFEVGEFRLQGFSEGIVFVRKGDLDSIDHVLW
jgi:hypothetical protein